ncbi:MAG TPA: exo-alpha-sialidase, partial [Rhodothermales bacterium]|nr:exo-alpha-sialidase [Rhodothermales bacterium]
MRQSNEIRKWVGMAVVFFLALAAPEAYAQAPTFKSEPIFPLQNDHTHGSTLVQLPNGDLLAGWFQGSGERQADDVRVMGARMKHGSDTWSRPFVLADVDAFPDINPVLFLDGKNRLWLMWYTVLANQWDTSVLKYRISEDYEDMAGAPEWDWQADLHVKPGGKTERGIQPDDPFVLSVKRQLDGLDPAETASIDAERLAEWKEETLAKASGQDMIREGRLYHADGTYEEQPMGYPYFRRAGWQTRNQPFITDSGRMIVPLYSDGFSFSLMAYTDDSGETWKFSEPLV